MWSQGLYYCLSLRTRTAGNFDAMRAANGTAWQIVSWLAVALNSLPFLQRIHLGCWDAVTEALAMIVRMLGGRNFEPTLSLQGGGEEEEKEEGEHHGHGHDADGACCTALCPSSTFQELLFAQVEMLRGPQATA